MSMILILKRISDADISRLRAQPEALRAFIARPQRDRGPEYAAARLEMMKTLMGENWQPPQMVALKDGDVYPFNEDSDMQKMWHAVYFLLTGSADVGVGPATILLHGEPVSDEDVGYGPAMAISAEETRLLNIYLSALARKDFEARFNGPAMMAADIYPQVWDEDAVELKSELGDAFDKLKAYCAICASHGLGMISYIS